MNGRLIYSATPHLPELEPGKGQVSWHLLFFGYYVVEAMF